ncbi:MAG: ABC transporter permease subunit, partial [Desulfosalsimonas sp.]
METSLFRKDIPFSAFLLFAALAVVPLFTDSFYIWQVVAMASLYAVWAMSWDIFSGYLGQISFGHAFFIGTGGFIAAILNKNLGLDPWITII